MPGICSAGIAPNIFSSAADNNPDDDDDDADADAADSDTGGNAVLLDVANVADDECSVGTVTLPCTFLS